MAHTDSQFRYCHQATSGRRRQAHAHGCGQGYHCRPCPPQVGEL